VSARSHHQPRHAAGVGLALLLAETAARAPERTAIWEGGIGTTYGDLAQRAGGAAERLRAEGVAANDRVVLFLERGVDAAAAYFGCLAFGAIPVLVTERARPRQLALVANDTAARFLITSAELLRRQPYQLARAWLVLDAAELPKAGRYEPVPRVGGDVAQIIYTSGSTGLPRGVTLSHSNLREGVSAVAGYLGLVEDDRVASLLSFSSVYGLNQLLCCVAVGASLVIERSPLAAQLVDRFRAAAVTVIAAVPPLWIQILAVPSFRDQPIPSLRILQNAGGHLPVPAVRDLRQAQPRAALFLNYGQTETFRGSYLPPDEVDRRPGSMGRAIPGAEIFVLREDLTPCDVGEVGELVFRGPTVALGYWNDPVATARVFRPNPLRPAGTPDTERVVFSGDLVRRDEDGFLHYVSRRDRMIKTLGFRVGPDEVIDACFASGEIREGIVVGEPDEQRGERIVAYVVLREGGSVQRLEQFIRVELPRHMQPSRIVPMTELPRTTAGKYDVSPLRASGTPQPGAAEPLPLAAASA
jgi:acyl-CoA synthetase (AMP-forming)/AMP-acid ligase II